MFTETLLPTGSVGSIESVRTVLVSEAVVVSTMAVLEESAVPIIKKGTAMKRKMPNVKTNPSINFLNHIRIF